MLRLQCLFGFHQPVRSEVIREATLYTGRCKECGQNIRRVRHGRWVRYNGAIRKS